MPPPRMKLPMGRGLPQTPEQWDERPYFLWDLDMSWRDFHSALHGDNPTRRRWALARLLTEGRWDDVWRLVTLDEVAGELPHLKMPGKNFWQALVDAT